MDTGRESSYAHIMITLRNKACWICRKPIGTERTWLDEYGFSVHETCFRGWAAQISAESLKKRPPVTENKT